MTTLHEKMQERMDQRPDAATLAWWDERYTEQAREIRGLIRACNLVLAEDEDRDAAVKKLHARVDIQGEELHEANAKIGKLQADVTLLKETVQKSRDAYAELKKKVK